MEGKLWRMRDQPVLAALGAIFVVGLGSALWLGSGRLVEIDRQPPIEAPLVVDLNTAVWVELAQLPGIGETLARRIVEHRLTHGHFITHDGLRDVGGIGPAKLERLRPHLLPIGAAWQPSLAAGDVVGQSSRNTLSE